MRIFSHFSIFSLLLQTNLLVVGVTGRLDDVRAVKAVRLRSMSIGKVFRIVGEQPKMQAIWKDIFIIV